MFIIKLTYLAPLARIEELLEEHCTFLRKFYHQGNFLLSGPQNPREGGIIIARADGLEEMKAIIAEDPFYREGVASYEFTEFAPTMYDKDLGFAFGWNVGD